MTNKLRLSWSFLNLWGQGRVNDALLAYFHVPRPTPPQYVNGRLWDEYCNNYINKHKTLPPEWGEDKLKAPNTQIRLKVPYSELCDLTGVFDVVDGKILYELKSGHSASARVYAGTMQVPLYLLMAHLNKQSFQKALVIRYNPKTNKQDRALLYPSERVFEKVRNYIDTLSGEIDAYFTKHDLYSKTDADFLLLTNN